MPKATIKLVPWDPESDSHIQRLVEQRKACGWAAEQVPQLWRDAHLAGTKCIWWIVLASDEPHLIEKHVSQYPAERDTLLDTSKTFRGVAVEPSGDAILPVGHVALDNQHPDAIQLGLPLPTEDAFWIKSLYVSYALQGSGIGSSAMSMAETTATGEPLNAKHLLLDTVHRDDSSNEEIAVSYFGQIPTVTAQDWYERRGYELVGTVSGFYNHPDRNGKLWPLRTVFMHRDLLKEKVKN